MLERPRKRRFPPGVLRHGAFPLLLAIAAAQGCRVNVYCSTTRDCDPGDVCNESGECVRAGSLPSGSSGTAGTSAAAPSSSNSQGGSSAGSSSASSIQSSSSSSSHASSRASSSSAASGTSSTVATSTQASSSSSATTASSGVCTSCQPRTDCGPYLESAKCVDLGCIWTPTPDCSGSPHPNCGDYSPGGPCEAAGCTAAIGCSGTLNFTMCSLAACPYGCAATCGLPATACQGPTCNPLQCVSSFTCTGTTGSACSGAPTRQACVAAGCTVVEGCTPRPAACDITLLGSCGQGCEVTACTGVPVACADRTVGICTIAQDGCSLSLCSGVVTATCADTHQADACAQLGCTWGAPGGTCSAALDCPVTPGNAIPCGAGCQCAL